MEYISALPPALDVGEYVEAAESFPELVIPVEGDCSYDKMMVPEGVLTTADGQKIKIPGGILLSDCKTEQLIRYKAKAEQFYVERNQLALVYRALDHGCASVEQMYQDQLKKEAKPDLWEQVDCEACFALGAATCVGVTYAVNKKE